MEYIHIFTKLIPVESVADSADRVAGGFSDVRNLVVNSYIDIEINRGQHPWISARDDREDGLQNIRVISSGLGKYLGVECEVLSAYLIP